MLHLSRYWRRDYIKWSVGVMEKRSNGKGATPNTPVIHYSNSAPLACAGKNLMQKENFSEINRNGPDQFIEPLILLIILTFSFQ
jgi:hypothetical protein